MTWRIFLFEVAPLLTSSLTVLLWVALIIIQTPRGHRTDTLNLAIAGILGTLSVYLMEETLLAAGVLAREPFDDQALILLAGAFSLVGLPKTLIELRHALDRDERREP